MKKILIAVAVLALIQNWQNIKAWIKPVPDFNSINQANVILYATSWCGYCDKTRKLLAEQGVLFKEFDIEKSKVGYEQHRELGGRGVPVLLIDGEVVHGYNPQQIMKLINN